MQATLSLEKRRDILQKEINGYVRRGFRVMSQTDTSAQLVKPKKFSFLWAMLWFLLLGIGLLIYLIYYWSQKDQTVYLSVDERGRVSKR